MCIDHLVTLTRLEFMLIPRIPIHIDHENTSMARWTMLLDSKLIIVAFYYQYYEAYLYDIKCGILITVDNTMITNRI